MKRYIISLDRNRMFLKHLEISPIYFEDENIHIVPTKNHQMAATFNNRDIAEKVKSLVNGEVCVLMNKYEVNINGD